MLNRTQTRERSAMEERYCDTDAARKDDRGRNNNAIMSETAYNRAFPSANMAWFRLRVVIVVVSKRWS